MRHEHYVCLAVEFFGGKATICNAFATDDLLGTTRSMNLPNFTFLINVPWSLPHETVNVTDMNSSI